MLAAQGLPAITSLSDAMGIAPEDFSGVHRTVLARLVGNAMHSTCAGVLIASVLEVSLRNRVADAGSLPGLCPSLLANAGPDSRRPAPARGSIDEPPAVPGPASLSDSAWIPELSRVLGGPGI